MSVKTIVTAFAGFLAHHRSDLNATAVTLNALLDALPVNRETRDHIKELISKVETSAVNIEAALRNFDVIETAPVTIKESDIEHALLSVVASGALDTLLASLIEAHFAAHPAQPATVAPEAVHTIVADYLLDNAAKLAPVSPPPPAPKKS